MSSMQLSEAGSRGRDGLKDVGNGRERMNGAHYILIKFGVISNEVNMFAVTFRYKKSGRAPVCGFITRNYDPRSYVFGNLRCGRLLKTEWYWPRG